MGNITIKNLTFAYPGQTTLFDHCQLSIDGSWKLGLLGRNGRGKTTLMKILLGQLEFQEQVQSNLPLPTFPSRSLIPTLSPETPSVMTIPN